MTNTITFHVYEMRGGPLDGEYIIFTGASAPTIYKHPLRATGALPWMHMPPVSAPPECHEYRMTYLGGYATIGCEMVDRLGSDLKAFVIEKMKTAGATGLMTHDG